MGGREGGRETVGRRMERYFFSELAFFGSYMRDM